MQLPTRSRPGVVGGEAVSEQLIKSIAHRIHSAVGGPYARAVESAAIAFDLLKPSRDEDKARLAELEARCAKYKAVMESFGVGAAVVIGDSQITDASPVAYQFAKRVLATVKALTEGGEHE